MKKIIILSLLLFWGFTLFAAPVSAHSIISNSGRDNGFDSIHTKLYSYGYDPHWAGDMKAVLLPHIGIFSKIDSIHTKVYTYGYDPSEAGDMKEYSYGYNPIEAGDMKAVLLPHIGIFNKIDSIHTKVYTYGYNPTQAGDMKAILLPYMGIFRKMKSENLPIRPIDLRNFLEGHVERKSGSVVLLGGNNPNDIHTDLMVLVVFAGVKVSA